MTIVIFILVLVALIVVHELGHFFAAKWAGMRVDEFGIGYPPKAWTFWRHNGTDYTLNWLPFGGFVKIFGEDESAAGGTAAADSFVAKPRIVQALVLVAGIAMNIAFAWVLLSVTLAIGLPRGLTDAEIPRAADATLAVARVVEGSPAADAGLKAGDVLQSASYDDVSFTGPDAEAFTVFIANSHGEPVRISALRDNKPIILTAKPETLVVPADPDRLALGIGIAVIGTIQVPWWQAPIDGALLTWSATQQVAVGLIHFFGGLVTFTADLSQVSGPIGIAGAVGTASDTGIAALLSLMAIISINLALINVLPVPALDGGRLLFVVIEAITRKPIPAGVANALNTGGFALLILLMLVVTASDLWKAFA